VSEGTISNYRVMLTSPKPEFIKKFCELYSVDEVWLMTGEGEPFPGARQKYPEVCGPPVIGEAYAAGPKLGSAYAAGPKIGAAFRESMDMLEKGTFPDEEGVRDSRNIARSIEMLMKIVGSGNQTLIRAIVSNLEAFSEAVDQKDRLQTLEAAAQEMAGKIAQLEQKTVALQTEVNRLRATHESPGGNSHGSEQKAG